MLVGNFDKKHIQTRQEQLNTVTLRQTSVIEADNKMRNIAHITKFVEPVTIEMEESDKQEQPV